VKDYTCQPLRRTGGRAILICGLLFLTTTSLALADSYRSYNAASAVSYALNNYNRAYGFSGFQNPFTDYSWVTDGGNCTNFASQVILGGLLQTSSAKTALDSRFDFDIDRTGTSYYKWYFISDIDRGTAWTSAHKLYEYAKYNKSTYKGLHFTFVTNDTLQTFMDYTKVKVGDIVFADWNHDGRMDHTLIVTGYDWWRWGYNEIRVTYQSYNKTDIGLGDINEQKNYQALFYVYRPVNYNPSGL